MRGVISLNNATRYSLLALQSNQTGRLDWSTERYAIDVHFTRKQPGRTVEWDHPGTLGLSSIFGCDKIFPEKWLMK